MRDFLRKYWFMIGLIMFAGAAIADVAGITVSVGRWLTAHGGPDAVIVLIFFLSGLVLETRQVFQGLGDFKGTLLALSVILIVSPFIASVYTLLPLETGILIGLFLVASMPTTLSSGVVMTGAAGGNMAHALLITICASITATFTIPLTLGILLPLAGSSQRIEIDSAAIMTRIATRVIIPLMAGLLARSRLPMITLEMLKRANTANQCLILFIVWMAMCHSREAILAGAGAILPVAAVVFSFHLGLVLAGLGLTQSAGIGPGRRESVIFMGGQKTLPLSVILQVALFPQYGLALVVCVLHHIIHLIMDAYLVQRLKPKIS